MHGDEFIIAKLFGCTYLGIKTFNYITNITNIILHKVIINYILSNNLSKCKHKLFNIYFS